MYLKWQAKNIGYDENEAETLRQLRKKEKIIIQARSIFSSVVEENYLNWDDKAVQI